MLSPTRTSVATWELAEFIATFSASALPNSALQATKTFVLDGSGALLAAANPKYSTGALIAQFALQQGGSPIASVVGHDFKTSVVNAALTNGTMGYACDIEPHHPEGILHPIAVMIPTALAIGEHAGSTGLEFLTAVALGCEVEYRVSIALGPAEQYRLGFHPSAVCGAFGAAAAAAWLLKLDTDSTIRALGLAACQASGMMAWETDPTENARPFQMGMAARNGVTAALLSKSGFGGPISIFDSGHTVFHAFSRAAQPAKLTEALGSKWEGVLGLAIKPYSCVSFLHPALDALFALLEEEEFEGRDVESLTMRFPRAGVHCVDGNPLKSHCAQYILPVALANRELHVRDIFTDQRESNPLVAELSQRVNVIADDELDKVFPDYYATVLEFKLKDGRTFTRRNDIARGYPEAPMTRAQITEKFWKLVGTVANRQRVESLLGAISGLPGSPNLDAYAQLLRTRAEAG